MYSSQYMLKIHALQVSSSQMSCVDPPHCIALLPLQGSSPTHRGYEYHRDQGVVGVLFLAWSDLSLPPQPLYLFDLHILV